MSDNDAIMNSASSRRIYYFRSNPCWFTPFVTRRLAEETTICGDLDKEASILKQTLKEKHDKLEKLKDKII